MVVFSDFGCQLGLFASVIDNLMIIAYPAALWFVNLVRIQVFVSISHALYYSIGDYSARQRMDCPYDLLLS